MQYRCLSSLSVFNCTLGVYLHSRCLTALSVFIYALSVFKTALPVFICTIGVYLHYQKIKEIVGKTTILFYMTNPGVYLTQCLDGMLPVLVMIYFLLFFCNFVNFSRASLLVINVC